MDVSIAGPWPVVGVIGGCGGVGASTVAAALAATAALGGRSVLVDLDSAAGGIDVLLGVEAAPGARWSGIRLGGGRLEPHALTDGLPQWAGAAVLSADILPAPEPVAQTLDVACRAGPTVVDLGRWASPARAAALRLCTLVVLVCGADVRALTGARAARIALGDPPMGVLVVRSGRELASARQVAALVDAPLIGTISALPRRGDAALDPRSLPRGLARIARGVLDAVDVPSREAAA